MGRPGKRFCDMSKLRLDADVILPTANVYLDKDGYPVVNIKGVSTPLHRWVMGAFPGDGKIVDHINRDKFDARRHNLRFVTYAESAQNISKTKKKTSSKYRGVALHRRSGKWIAQVRSYGRTVWSGSFTNEEAANKACIGARIKYFPKSMEEC